MVTRADLKRSAKASLRGKWGISVVCTLIVTVIIAVIQMLGMMPGMVQAIAGAGDPEEVYLALYTSPWYFISTIVVFLIAVGLGIGLTKLFLRISRNSDASVGTVFEGFKIYGRAFVMMLLEAIFIYLWSLLLVIPGIVASYRYRMASYILLDDDSVSGLDAIRQSKEMMRGHKGELFIMDLSFIGWMILAAIPCGLGYFWLSPYMEVSYANFYRNLKGEFSASSDAAVGA